MKTEMKLRLAALLVDVLHGTGRWAHRRGAAAETLRMRLLVRKINEEREAREAGRPEAGGWYR